MALQFYLVRHGEATTDAEDPTRPLNDRGREQVQRVAWHVAALGLEVGEIRYSDKLRARQTAEILAEHLSPRRGIREVEGLAPSDDPGKALAELKAATEPLMLVGHLPHLSRLASGLLFGDPEREILSFDASAIACLESTKAGFRLLWILTPELARGVVPSLYTGRGG